MNLWQIKWFMYVDEIPNGSMVSLPVLHLCGPGSNPNPEGAYNVDWVCRLGFFKGSGHYW